MKKIELHGALAKKFGRFFTLDVSTAREATHAIATQIPAFKKFMLQAEQKGIKFAVFTDDKNIGERELDNQTDAEVIHIMPKVVGAGGDTFGVLTTIAGAALIGFGAAGWGFLSLSAGGTIGVGVSLMMGGMSNLLLPTPELPTMDPDGNRANYGFGGAVTTVAQGNPVPVAYGERDLGGFIISAGIFSEDQQ